MAMNNNKLKIVSLEPIRAVGDKGAKLLSFIATNEANITEKYSVFDTILFPHIIPNTTIDAEWEFTENVGKNGTKYINRKLTNIMQEGVKVIPSAQSKVVSGSGKSYGKTPDERISIERQVACKLALEFAKGQTLIDTLNNATIIYNWISGK